MRVDVKVSEFHTISMSSVQNLFFKRAPNLENNSRFASGKLRGSRRPHLYPKVGAPTTIFPRKTPLFSKIFRNVFKINFVHYLFVHYLAELEIGSFGLRRL